jgi:hypothetical protein
LISTNDAWFVRNRLLKQLFSRDLFDYTLPLDNDLFFFGRATIVADSDPFRGGPEDHRSRHGVLFGAIGLPEKVSRMGN